MLAVRISAPKQAPRNLSCIISAICSGMIASFPPGGGTCWIVRVAVGVSRRHERRDGWRMPRRRERRRRDTREGRSRIASIGFDVRFDRAGRSPHLQSERACAPSSCETKRNDIASPNSIEGQNQTQNFQGRTNCTTAFAKRTSPRTATTWSRLRLAG